MPSTGALLEYFLMPLQNNIFDFISAPEPYRAQYRSYQRFYLEPSY